MPTPTYTLIDSVTLGSSASGVTFSSIPAGGDLVLAADVIKSTNSRVYLKINGDSGTNYNNLVFAGTGSAAFGDDQNNADYYWLSQGGSSGGTAQFAINFMDYSASDKHKSFLVRWGIHSTAVSANIGRWASTSAITSLAITVESPAGVFAAGSTFFLYHIAKDL
jgi:hypothetical protein